MGMKLAARMACEADKMDSKSGKKRSLKAAKA
jgi:hypothetical protein